MRNNVGWIKRINNDNIMQQVQEVYVVRYAIWYHLYNFKNVKNTHRVVLILVKLQA